MQEAIDANIEAKEKIIEFLAEKGILSAEEREIIRTDKIEAFLESDIGKKLRSAKRVYREEPFVIYISASEVSNLLPEDEKICVQGIIDCYFELDDSTVVLLDYKTDSYTNPREISEKYNKQIMYYEKALKSKFGDKIIQKYLYLLHKNDIIEL